MSATPLLARLGALRDEFATCARLASVDNNNEASLAFAAARDRLDEVVVGYVAEDKASFFNPALGTPSPSPLIHGPN